ncbi:uncharacterized protein CELE_F53C3.7 [Caenorhabditis elegans]|uniref:Uncharacterized protein n=1 Tax=Caenorhabditis elegans TaxID=6239 RepID=Q9TXT2_CAEEL|nr:Uncharacterized protein CELE_F53C3.7 [Caenorhabditis elegans]CCD67677.2 Uncharacterized protein CELE_F53C3.7 [Caenorhabditis elegans]
MSHVYGYGRAGYRDGSNFDSTLRAHQRVQHIPNVWHFLVPGSEANQNPLAQQWEAYYPAPSIADSENMGFVATWDEHLARDREPVRDVEQPGISNGDAEIQEIDEDDIEIIEDPNVAPEIIIEAELTPQRQVNRKDVTIEVIDLASDGESETENVSSQNVEKLVSEAGEASEATEAKRRKRKQRGQQSCWTRKRQKGTYLKKNQESGLGDKKRRRTSTPTEEENHLRKNKSVKRKMSSISDIGTSSRRALAASKDCN